MQTQFDQRENNFDFIRMALAVLVIFSHSYALGTGSFATEPCNRLTHNQVSIGSIAVDLFFIISGFLITASYERSASISSYLKKRILRIYPAFIVAMLFELILVPVAGGHLVPQPHIPYVMVFIIQTLRLREFHYAGVFLGVPYPGQMNGSIWSIQYEFWCYLSVIVLGVAGILRSKKILLVGFFCAIILSYLFLLLHWQLSLKPAVIEIFGFVYSWFRLLPLYLAGIVFYKWRSHLSLHPGWIVAACAALAISAVTPFGCTLFFPIAGTYLVLVLAFHPRIRLHGWARFGDFSYGTYLYAFPVQQLVMRLVGHAVSPWVLFSLATPPTILCAVASWHLVERRFLERVRPTAVTA